MTACQNGAMTYNWPKGPAKPLGTWLAKFVEASADKSKDVTAAAPAADAEKKPVETSPPPEEPPLASPSPAPSEDDEDCDGYVFNVDVAPEAPKAPKLKLVSGDSASMQGRSPVNEDRHAKIMDLTKAARALKLPIDHLPQPTAYFGVFDGHRGSLCSEFMAKSFHGKLLKKLANTENCQWPNKRVGETLIEVFAELDKEFMEKNRTANDGCTAAVALVLGSLLFTASLGDSRVIACQKASDDSFLTLDLTEDHRPTVEKEQERVVANGCEIVEYHGGYRVAKKGFEAALREERKNEANGLGKSGKEPQCVHVTRALGNRDFKAASAKDPKDAKDLISVRPDVRCTRLEPSHKFIALTSAGISDVMQNEEVIFELAFVRETLKASCASVVNQAFSRGSSENLTVILARFEWPFTPGNTGSASDKAREALKRKKERAREKAAKAARTDQGKQTKADEFFLEAVSAEAL